MEIYALFNYLSYSWKLNYKSLKIYYDINNNKNDFFFSHNEKQ